MDDAPEDQSLLYYDVQLHKARTIQKPATQDGPLVPVLDGDRVTYREYKAGGEGEGDANNWSGTLAEYETAEQVVDPDDPDYIKDKSGVDIYGLTAADLDIATEVREGDNQPVTSDAVYDAMETLRQQIIDSFTLDWTSATSPTDILSTKTYICTKRGIFYLKSNTNTSEAVRTLNFNGVLIGSPGAAKANYIQLPCVPGDVFTATGGYSILMAQEIPYRRQ